MGTKSGARSRPGWPLLCILLLGHVLCPGGICPHGSRDGLLDFQDVRALGKGKDDGGTQGEREEAAGTPGRNEIAFFTNISHEFRTPLTLILTPLGSLIKQQSDVDLKQRLVVIYRNAEKLLQLVNQLLDFRKLEMQGERLSVRMGDIVVFVQDAVEAFCELVKEKVLRWLLKVRLGICI